MSPDERIREALDLAVRSGGIACVHHKAWVIDQMVRVLTGCLMVEEVAVDSRGKPYTCQVRGESDSYKQLVAEACAGPDGPHSYNWDTGIPP